MDGYGAYACSPEPVARTSTRERDDYARPNDTYRDRRRSPGRDRRDTRDRRRSRSPAPVDRYEPSRMPRDDYRSRTDFAPRDRRRSSPERPGAIDRYVPGQDTPAPALLINPLPDPMKLDFQVGFTWFAEWWRTEQRIKAERERAKTSRPPPRVRGERETREEREAERPKIQAAYDQYKENLQKQQAQTFVRLHKGEDWFRERYVREVRDPYRRRLMEYRKGLFAQWAGDLEAGVFDDFTLEGIYKSESNGLGGILEKEEGETTAAAEVLGVADLLPTGNCGELRDPIAQQPTLLIKTIAPTVTREKFEQFAKEHLGEDEGGFKHLSLSDPNPLKKCHRMGWIMLNSEPEREPSPPPARSNPDAEEGEADAMERSMKPNLLIPSERALDRINGKTIEDPERGNFTVHCGVHRPPEAPRKKALWDLFSAPERVQRDLELATRLVRRLDDELGEDGFGVAKIEAKVDELLQSGKLQPATSASKAQRDPTTADFNMDAEEGEEDEGQVPDSEDDVVDDEDLLVKRKKLDLLVEYLRRVYNFCFFCVFESDSVHELQRKCPGGHLRRPRASLTSAALETARASAAGEPFPLRSNRGNKESNGSRGEGEDAELAGDGESPVEERGNQFSKPNMRTAQQLQRAYNWVRTFEEKILQILEPENMDLKKVGGIPVEEGMEEELNKFVKQEDTHKYRCKVPDCTKLFKGPDFWRKHVEKRHPEFHANILCQIQLVNTYVLDPAHIAPSRSDANSNGHFPLGNGNVPTGTPRGFSLGHQFPMGFPMAAGMPSAMSSGVGGFQPPGMIGGLPTGMPMGWGPPGSATNPIPGMGMAMGMGGVGPMRNNYGRGPMNGGYRMPGPYQRNDGRGRAPSFSSGMGRPMMGMGVMEGGVGMMGPKEAVQGRSLRSYEDLDAAGDAGQGKGTGVLDY